MMRTFFTSAAFAVVAAGVSAQVPGAAAKAAAQKAVAATNAHTEAEQAPMNDAAAHTTTVAQPPQSAKPAAQKSASALAKSSGAAAVTTADSAGPTPTIWREQFEYSADRRRDPFNSLLTTNELRPTMSDLKVTGILYDPSGRRSFATLRDLTSNAQYRVTMGTTLGRMRVAAIRTRIVVFTIDEFGTTRQDSLVFGDTTKARVK